MCPQPELITVAVEGRGYDWFCLNYVHTLRATKMGPLPEKIMEIPPTHKDNHFRKGNIRRKNTKEGKVGNGSLKAKFTHFTST